jgi:hypothetical protein
MPQSGFKWQRSFYDRVIRNEKELFNIQHYIVFNALKWPIDKNGIINIDLNNVKSSGHPSKGDNRGM